MSIRYSESKSADDLVESVLEEESGMARERGERSGETVPEQFRSLSVAELRQLISLMNGSDIDEIAIEQEAIGLKLTLRKPTPITLSASAASYASNGDDEVFDVAEPSSSPADEANAALEIRSTLVGVFRVSMKSGGKPLAALGDVVREGQVVGAIEALNVLNEIEAPAQGRVSAVFVDEGQPVEYGQPLIAIEPLARS